MRTAARIAAAALALAGTPAAAQAMPAMPGMSAGPATGVSIGYSAFAPAHVDVLAGDQVHWMNDSVRRHTVTSDDDSWTSSQLVPGGMFTRRFERPGAYTYYCTVHAGMTGEVDAHTLLLRAATTTAAPGRSYPLTGRAALAAGSEVAIEADSGSGFVKVAAATVADDGSFAAAVTPTTSVVYRAKAANAEPSPRVGLHVLDHRVGATVTRGAHRAVIAVHVTPADPGATVVLQLRLRDRFGWWPLTRMRLDRRSRARFVVAARTGVPARVLLTLPDGATELARGRTLSVAPPAHVH